MFLLMHGVQASQPPVKISKISSSTSGSAASLELSFPPAYLFPLSFHSSLFYVASFVVHLHFFLITLSFPSLIGIFFVFSFLLLIFVEAPNTFLYLLLFIYFYFFFSLAAFATRFAILVSCNTLLRPLFVCLFFFRIHFL